MGLFPIIYFTLLSILIIFVNVLYARKKSFPIVSIILVNVFLISTSIIIFLFVESSGGFRWWNIAPKYWSYFGSFISAILLASTILIQFVAFRRQQVENKFFDLVKYYRANVNEMELRNPFFYEEGNGRKSEEEYVKGRRVIKIIFDQYCAACNIVSDFISENKIENVYNENDQYKQFHNDIYKKIEKAGKRRRLKAQRSKKCLEEFALTIQRKQRFIVSELAYMITFWGVPMDASTELRFFVSGRYSHKIQDLIESFKKFPALYDCSKPKELKTYMTRNNTYTSGCERLKAELDVMEGKGFIKFFGGHQYQLGHYFRHLFQTVRYIDKQPNYLLSFESKKEYIKTLRAQMSNYEQALLFINSLSQLGRKWEYINKDGENLISKYQIIRNLPRNFVPEMMPHVYYPDIQYEFEDDEKYESVNRT